MSVKDILQHWNNRLSLSFFPDTYNWTEVIVSRCCWLQKPRLPGGFSTGPVPLGSNSTCFLEVCHRTHLYPGGRQEQLFVRLPGQKPSVWWTPCQLLAKSLGVHTFSYSDLFCIKVLLQYTKVSLPADGKAAEEQPGEISSVSYISFEEPIRPVVYFLSNRRYWCSHLLPDWWVFHSPVSLSACVCLNETTWGLLFACTWFCHVVGT